MVVAGHCTIDDIHRADGQVLPATPGGAAAYATLGAAMCDARVTLITLLGNDYPFDRFRDGLAGHGKVELNGVRWAGPRSIHNVAWYRADGSRHFDIESWDVMDALTPTSADLAPYMCADRVVLLTPGSLPKQLEAARLARARGCPVVVDTEIHYFSDADEKQCLREVVAESTYFLPSIEHLQALYGNSSPDIGSYLDWLPGLGCRWIVVKQGAQGSTLVDCGEGRTWQVPAVPGLRVRDVTGAGDGFGGGFAAALADGKDPLDAACWGTVTASFVVESIGAVMPPHFDRALALGRYARVWGQVTDFMATSSVGGHGNRDS